MGAIEVVSIGLNAGLLIATCVAAFIAWRGVKATREATEEARDARDESSAAAGRAQRTADRAAESAESAAESLRRMAGPDHPWTMTREAPSTWTLLNAGSRDVEAMSIEVADADAPEGIVTSPHMGLAGPNFISSGEPIRLRFNGGTVTDPFEVRIHVRYRFVDDPLERIWTTFVRN